ncbi:MAG: hypothetical protein VX899_00275 [Myxococcota bacterium]|nr:hypothetical protein [Myxococcota bacterium]
MRRFYILLSSLFLFFAAPAMAGSKSGEGKRVRVQVIDPQGQPVSTAVIRHPDEADRHRVNSVDGTWEDEVLYLPDGSPLYFVVGEILVFEVSAPGYETTVVSYQVERRGNDIKVTLNELEYDSGEIDEPMMSFGRDVPRDEGGAGPAN